MTQLNRDGTSGFGSTLAALKPEQFVKNWQQNTVRVLRAQERLMQGVAAAARVELRYGQELIANRLNFLKWDRTELPHAGDHAAQEVEKFAAVIREVTEELRNGLTEATKLLSEGAPENRREAVSHKAEDVSRKVEEVEENAARKTTAPLKHGKNDEG